MPSAKPPYLIRHLDGRAEYDALSAQIMDWRRARSLPSETFRPILTALRDEREVGVLVDTHDDRVVGCLHLFRAPLPTPPWTDAERAQPTLTLASAATAPGADDRLGRLLTTWVRHYAARGGHTQVACTIPLRHFHDSTARRLVDHLVDGCGWNRQRTAHSATGTAVLLTATARPAEGLDAYLTTRVLPVLFAERETVS